MAQTASAEFDALVESVAHEVDYSLVLTLPVGVDAGYGDLTDAVVSIDLDKAIQTDTNEQTTNIGGFPAMELTVELSGLLTAATGESVDAATFFNTGDPDSPLYGSEPLGWAIVCDQGVYVDDSGAPEMIRQFTGIVDTIDINQGVVTVTCVDNSGQIRGSANLPPVITQAPYNAGLTPEFAVDYLLRHSSPAKFYSWPALRDDCVLAVGMRSSIWPDVGSYLSYVQAPNFIQGVHGSALSNSPLTVYELTSPITPAQSYFAEVFASNHFEMNIDSDAADYQIHLTWFSSGNLRVYSESPSGQSTQLLIAALGTTGSHYFAISATWPSGSTTVSGTVRVDGTSYPFSVTATDTRPADADFVQAALGGTGAVEGWQVTTETSPAFNNGFVPTLVLDPSLNSLTALPDVSGKSVWSVLQEIASAEDAVVGLDELGVFYFKNRDTIKGAASTRDIRSETSLLGLSTSLQRSMVATHVQIPVNQVAITPLGSVWSATTVMEVPASGTLEFFATTQNPVVNVQTPDSGFAYAGTFVAGNTYWRGNTQADGLGISIETGIHVNIEQLSPTSLKVTVTNDNAYPVQLCSGGSVVGDTPGDLTGVPGLVIGGQAVVAAGDSLGLDSAAGAAAVADKQWPVGDAASNTTYGDKLLAVPANDWVQDLPTAEVRAWDLIGDLHSPKVVYRNVSYVDDPRVQLTDCVTLLDPDVSQVTADVLLLHVHKTLSDGQWAASADVRGKYRPAAWELGVSTLGVDNFLF